MLVETGKKIFYLSPDTGKESGNISTPDEDGTSNLIYDIQANSQEVSDDHFPFFHKSSVSRLEAIIIVMLFSLPHQLPGQALVDLVKALLTDGHKFVSSTY